MMHFSGWNSDGCKLMASNRTHSICGCNQLNTFALLTDLDQNENFNGFNHNHRHRSQQLEAQQDVSSGHFDFSNIQAKRPLESVENELVLPLTEATSNGNNNNNNNNVNSPTSSNLVGSSSKLLYLAKVSSVWFVYLFVSLSFYLFIHSFIYSFISLTNSPGQLSSLALAVAFNRHLLSFHLLIVLFRLTSAQN